jgi:hypothetical protein
MDDGPHPAHHSRDRLYHRHNLSHRVYGLLASRATTTSIRPSCAPSKTPSKQTPLASNAAGISPLNIKLTRNTANPSWLPQTRRTRLQSCKVELHQSTCLNLNLASDDSTESDLWILPDFDDWELDSDIPSPAATKGNAGEWAPLLHRAASSNRERLRARLEGDGWDFVGGKYGEEEAGLQEAIGQSQESVDEEFDVVVLPTRVRC